MSRPATRPADVATARESVLSRHRTLFGSSVQVAVVGVYTWAVTVAPAAWSMGANVAVKILALIGLVALAAPLVARAASSDSPRGTSPPASSPLSVALGWLRRLTLRSVSFWSFVLSSAAVWALAPSSFVTSKFDAMRGALGVVGWLLYAFAWAGPSLDPSTIDAAPAVPLSPRGSEALGHASRIDDVWLALGLLLAIALQFVGWSVASPGRAVLVRIVTVATGIALFSTSATVILARHVPRARAPHALRLRRALPWVLLLALFWAAGAVFLFDR